MSLKTNWINERLKEILMYSDDGAICTIKTGKLLRELRKRLYVTLKQVCHILKVRYSSACKIEIGKTSCSRKLYFKYIGALYDIAEEIHRDIEDTLWDFD